MSECPDPIVNRADSAMEMIAEIERLQERTKEQCEAIIQLGAYLCSHADSLKKIIVRGENGELGTSKVIDMASIAALSLNKPGY